MSIMHSIILTLSNVRYRQLKFYNSGHDFFFFTDLGSIEIILSLSLAHAYLEPLRYGHRKVIKTLTCY